MAIKLKENGLWMDVSVTKDGSRTRYRKMFTGTHSEALIWHAFVEKQMKDGVHPDDIPDPNGVNQNIKTKKKKKKAKKAKKTKAHLPLEATLEAVWGRYWKNAGQAKTVRSPMKLATDFFGTDCDIREITTEEIDRYIDHMQSNNLSASTIHKRCAVLSKMFRHCKNRKMIQPDDVPHFELPKIGDNSRHRFLSPFEEAEVLSLMNDSYDDAAERQREGRIPGAHYAALFEFLIDTGVRPIEARNIEATNLNVDLLTLLETKNDERRTIPLTKRALAAFKFLQAEYGIKPFAWATASRITAGWKFARLELGMTKDKDFVPYITRHTCATRIYDKTRDLLVTKEWMGHKTIQITLRYAKLQPDDLIKVRALLDAEAAEAA